MMPDEDARHALARQHLRERMHSLALRAESLRVMELLLRERKRLADLRFIALLRLAEVHQRRVTLPWSFPGRGKAFPVTGPRSAGEL